jgi:hypothetical protein
MDKFAAYWLDGAAFAGSGLGGGVLEHEKEAGWFHEKPKLLPFPVWC